MCDKLLQEYFHKNLTHEEISVLLLEKHQIKLSVTTVKRKLHALGLKRRNAPESSIEEICYAVVEEISSCGYNLGYRALWQKLKKNYKLNVKRDTVYRILRIADPEGIEERFGNKLRRRRYLSPGPNYTWHLDGYDKLKQFGFAIHGCVDGFSRMIIWLEVATTNNNPKVTAYHFLNAVKELQFLPRIIRADKGTENTLIGLLQTCLRSRHDDEESAESFIQGKSTANQRIESYWGRMRQHSADYFIQFFKCMQQKNLFNGSKLHIECLQYCFGPLLRYELNCTKELWNTHRIRKQAAQNNIAGRPFVMFHLPQKWKKKNFKKEVNRNTIQALINNFTERPKLYSDEIKELIDNLLNKHQVPSTVEEALTMYKNILELLENYK